MWFEMNVAVCYVPTWSQFGAIVRDHIVHVPSQWETTLQCNVVSHWPSVCREWSLIVLWWCECDALVSPLNPHVAHTRVPPGGHAVDSPACLKPQTPTQSKDRWRSSRSLAAASRMFVTTMAISCLTQYGLNEMVINFTLKFETNYWNGNKFHIEIWDKLLRFSLNKIKILVICFKCHWSLFFNLMKGEKS